MASSTLGTAYIEIVGKTDKFGSSIDKGVSKETEAAGKKHQVPVEGDTKQFGKSIEGGVLGSVKEIAKKAALTFGLAFTIEKGFEFFKDAIKEGDEARKVFAQTEAVIKSTGGAAGVSAKQVEELAQKLAGVTGIDDEAITSVQNMLLTFTAIRNEAGKGNDIFDQATQTVLDLSKALGEDTKGAAIQLGKALQDPVRGMTALRRVGVAFTTAQQDQVKALVNSGHQLEAQKLILAELSKEFGGSAAAQATATQKLHAVYKNFKENIGQLLLVPIDVAATALTKVLPKAFDGIRFVGNKLAPVFKVLGASIRVFTVGLVAAKHEGSGFIGFVSTLGVVVGKLTGISTILTGIPKAIAGFRGIPVDGGPAAKFFAAIGKGARAVFDQIPKVVSFLKPQFETLGAAVAGFNAALSSGQTTTDGFVGFAETVGAAVHDLGVQIAGFAQDAAGDIVKGFEGLPSDGGAAATFFHAVGTAAAGLVDFFKGEQFAGIVDATKAKLAGLADDGGKLVKFFQDNTQAADTLKVVLAGVAGAIGTIVVANKALSGIKAISTGLSALSGLLPTAIAAGPITLIVAAVVAVGAAGFVAYKKFKPFRDLIDTIGRGIAKGAVAAFDGIKVAISAIGDVAGPVVRDLVGAFGAVSRFLAPVVATIEDVGAAIGRFLGPVLVTVGAAFRDFFGFLVRNAPAAFDAVGRAAGTVGDVIGGIVGVVVTVSGALATAFKAVVGFVRNAAAVISQSKVFQFLVEQVQNFAGFIVEIAPQVAEAVRHIVNVIRKALAPLVTVFKAVVEVIGTVLGTLVDLTRATVELIGKGWSKISFLFTGPVKEAFKLIVTIAKAGIEAFRAVFSVVLAAVLFVWRKWGDDLLKIIKGVFEPVVAVVRFVVNTIANVIRLVLDIINGDWGKAWQAAKDIVKGAVDLVVGIVKGLIDVITGILGGLADTVSGIFHNAWDAVSGIVGDAVGAVVDFVTGLPGRIVDAAAGLIEAVGNLFGAGWDIAKGIASAAVENIVGFVVGLPGRLLSAAASLVSTVRDLFGTAWHDLTIIANVAVDNIVGFVEGLPGRIAGLVGSIFGSFSSIGKSILDGILDGLKAAGGFALDIAKAVGNAIIDIVNDQVIHRINSIQIKIPVPFAKDITVGGPNIPDIPHLASGGIAKANRPVTAVIGDNRTRDEAVVPLPPGFVQAMEVIAKGKGVGGTQLMGDVTIVESANGRGTYSDLVRAVRNAQFLTGWG